MRVLRHHHFSEEEYLRAERESASKHEFYAGVILGMAWGSLRHNRLCSRINFVLCRLLVGHCCQPSSSDQRLMTPDRLYTYPDVAVYCGKIEVRPGTTDVATNPKLVVEVLSDSTREYDLGDKLQQYQLIPSVEHVLLFEADEARVVVVSRTADGWVTEAFTGLQSTIPLTALGISVELGEVYAGVVGLEGPLDV